MKNLPIQINPEIEYCVAKSCGQFGFVVYAQGTQAEAIANEWVVPNRLRHAESHFADGQWKIENLGKILTYIVDDVLREAAGEIIDSPEVRKAISTKARNLFKEMYLSVKSKDA